MCIEKFPIFFNFKQGFLLRRAIPFIVIGKILRNISKDFVLGTSLAILNEQPLKKRCLNSSKLSREDGMSYISFQILGRLCIKVYAKYKSY